MQSDILMVVSTLLEDTVYDKFGYEIEDVERKIQEINFDTSKRNELRRKMEAEIGGFVEEVLPPENENNEERKQHNSRSS